MLVCNSDLMSLSNSTPVSITSCTAWRLVESAEAPGFAANVVLPVASCPSRISIWQFINVGTGNMIVPSKDYSV